MSGKKRWTVEMAPSKGFKYISRSQTGYCLWRSKPVWNENIKDYTFVKDCTGNESKYLPIEIFTTDHPILVGNLFSLA